MVPKKAVLARGRNIWAVASWTDLQFIFRSGIAAVVLVLLGGTTWRIEGFWALDGAYSRFISPTVGLIWDALTSWLLFAKSLGTRVGW